MEARSGLEKSNSVVRESVLHYSVFRCVTTAAEVDTMATFTATGEVLANLAASAFGTLWPPTSRTRQPKGMGRG